MKPKIHLKPKTSPLLASLPDHLKDPRNYDKIQKAIYETFATTCSHSDMFQWAECRKCTSKMLERRLLLKRLGFKNPAQYMAWKKVHTEIRVRFPLLDWSKENAIRSLEKLK